jgi:hypothetical protein
VPPQGTSEVIGEPISQHPRLSLHFSENAVPISNGCTLMSFLRVEKAL